MRHMILKSNHFLYLVILFSVGYIQCECAFKNKNLWYNINDGSPYVFAEVPKGFSSADFCARLLRETGVVAAAGSNFGKAGEGFFRLSAFCSREDAFWAGEAVGNFLETL